MGNLSNTNERPEDTSPPVTRRGSRWANFGLAAVSIVLACFVVEVGYRIATGLPAFKFANWRTERVVENTLGERAVVDPVLGWVLKPNNADDDHNTIDHGIRKNYDEKTIRTGAILAVGDSFTEGWEVEDNDSWPAYLEKLIETPVVNGGVGGYGTDQIIMRTEQLLPIVKPKTLIVGFLEFDIFRTGHSHFGAPKPWFTIENDELKYHPPPPIEVKTQNSFLTSARDVSRDILGYSAVADHLFAGMAPNYWYGGGQKQWTRADTDAVRVTCKLLERLKKKVDADGIRMLLFMQYYAHVVMAADEPPDHARRVVQCAQAMGIQVVNQYRSLRALYVADRNALRGYYMTYGDTYTHMNAAGNVLAAKLLADALGK
jgi:lysophospholipase L1-like esterase